MRTLTTAIIVPPQATKTSRLALKANNSLSYDKPALKANNSLIHVKPALKANNSLSHDKPSLKANISLGHDRPALTANNSLSHDKPALKACNSLSHKSIPAKPQTRRKQKTNIRSCTKYTQAQKVSNCFKQCTDVQVLN